MLFPSLLLAAALSACAVDPLPPREREPGTGSADGGSETTDGAGAGGRADTGTDALRPASDANGDPGEFAGGGADAGSDGGTAAERRKALSIDGAQVPSALTGFPVLVRITDSDLAAKAEPSGLDIHFEDDAGRALAFDRQAYASGSGTLVAWVVMNLTGGDQDFHLYYGSGDRTERSDPAAVWTNGYAAVYHLDGAATGMQTDSTSNGNHASPDSDNCADAAPVDQLSGHVHRALTFGEHACDRLIAQDGPSLDIGNELAVSAWIRPSTAGNLGHSEVIVAKRARTTEETNYQVALDQSHDMFFMWGWDTGNYPTYRPSTSARAPQNAWSYAVWTVQGNPKALRVYLDGVLRGADTNLSNFGLPINFQLELNSNDKPLIIGSADQETDEVFVGDLDELRVASISRSADWIATEYANQKAGSTFLAVGPEEAR